MGKDKISDKLAPKGQSHRTAQEKTATFVAHPRQPRTLQNVMDEQLGVMTDPKLYEQAVRICHDHMEGVVTDIKTWHIITLAIAEGIRQGYDQGLLAD